MNIAYKQLEDITDGFSNERILGHGMFGVVYKGEDKDGQQIAVKLLNFVHGVDDQTFHTECKNLAKLKHQNIVQLVGFCNETEEAPSEHNENNIVAPKVHRALCFEYMQNGTLQKHLSEESQGFGWYEHYKIIKGICEGLKYLHMGLESPVYHLDLRPNNILLDNNMVPKIADFGLSMLLGTEPVSFAGAHQYIPPEYIKHEVISKEFDIFSLGAIILDIVFGHMGYSITDEMEPAEVIGHVHNKWRERLQAMPRYPLLEADCQQVKRCVEIAVKCLEQDRHKRPSIGHIVQNLNETETIAFVVRSMRTGETNYCTGIRDNMDNEEPVNMPYEFLKRITDGLSVDRILGEGTFGVVYKGIDKAGIQIAVKILKFMPGVDDMEFHREFNNLSKLKHRNIVKFLGFCDEEEVVPYEHNGSQIVVSRMYRALCFEYMHNGSLQNHLYGVYQGFDWHKRYEIIKGICEGLKYLHMELESPVHHLDLKPDNILLDENMVPKIGDFGLSRLLGEANTKRTIHFVGTLGYCPPEFIKYQIISKEFDIFSLGVIIIKIMCGPSGHSLVSDMKPAKFVKHVYNNWKKRLQAFLGPTRKVCCQQVKNCLEIAIKCIDEEKKRRPNIGYIVEQLTETEKGKNPRVSWAEKFNDGESIPPKSKYPGKESTSMVATPADVPLHQP